MDTKKKYIMHMLKYLSVLICAVSVLMSASACTKTRVVQSPESVIPEVLTEPASSITNPEDVIPVPAGDAKDPAAVIPIMAGNAQDPAVVTPVTADDIQNPVDIAQTPADGSPNPVDEAARGAVQDDGHGRYDAVTRDLTEQLICAYPEDEGGAKSRQLLRELRNVSPESSMVWEQILDYWDKINTEDFVNVISESDQMQEDTVLLSANLMVSNTVPLSADLTVSDTEILPVDDMVPLPADLPDDDSLCIIILGYALNPDGTMKEELISRLRLGLSCAMQYPNAYVMVTGGGTASADPQATEADCMAAWLLENGLDPGSSSRLIIENRSMTSAENAVFCTDIIKSSYPQIKKAVIVTTDYHVPLGCLLFESQFLLSKEDPAARTQNAAEEQLVAPQAPSGQLAVIANAGVPAPDKSAFTLKSQAYWLLQLISYD